MQTILDDRDRLLNNIIYGMFMQGDYSFSIKPLENLKNDWLLGEYANLVAKFKKSVDEQSK
jgi:hypothetical protein